MDPVALQVRGLVHEETASGLTSDSASDPYQTMLVLPGEVVFQGPVALWTEATPDWKERVADALPSVFEHPDDVERVSFGHELQAGLPTETWRRGRMAAAGRHRLGGRTSAALGTWAVR